MYDYLKTPFLPIVGPVGDVTGVVGQRAACPILLNPPTHLAAPPKPLGQPLSLRSFLGPTVGDLVLQAAAYGMSPLFMLRGGGGIGVYHPGATENRWKENTFTGTFIY